MNRHDWIEVSAWVSICALWTGIGASFLISGMEWAALVGTIPSFAFIIAVRKTDWSKPQ
jgi:hypothetical protein